MKKHMILSLLLLGMMLISLGYIIYICWYKYTALMNKYKELQEQKQTPITRTIMVENNNEKIEQEKQALQQEKQQLLNKILELERKLNTTTKWLDNNITYYSELVEKLEEKIRELVSENKELVHELEKYRRRINELTNNTENLSTELTVYLEQLKLYTDFAGVGQEERDKLLNESIMQAKELIVELGLDGYDGLDFIIEAFKWIMLSLSYHRDPYVWGYSDYWGWGRWNDVLEMPNETVAIGGGDCEDLALLMYSFAKAKGYKAFMLVAGVSGSAHVAVIIRHGEEWYIVDPAGYWINNYNFLLKLSIRQGDGKTKTYYFDPMHVSPSLKQVMIQDNVIETIWVRSDTGNETTTPKLKCTDIRYLLEKWSAYWDNAWDTYCVIDVGTYKEFDNVEDLVGFLLLQ